MMTAAPRASAWSHTAFLLLLIVAFASTLAALQAVLLGVAFVVVMCKMDLFALSGTRERILMGLMVLTVTVMLPVSLLRAPAALVHYVVTLLSMAMAYLMTVDRERYLVASRVSLLAVQAAVFAYLSVRGFDNFPLENMIFESSSNGITSYMIILQANYSVFHFLLRRKGSLLTALLTLAICIVGYGRGSILASTFIVVINILSFVSFRHVGSALLRILGIVLVIGTIALLYTNDIALYLEANTKLGGGLYDSARERIIYDYLGKIDAVTLLTGAGYDGTSIVTEFRGNPHNSYVRGHHIFGLPYLLMLAAFPLALLAVRQRWSVKLYGAAMLVTVLFRASTEPVLFPTVFDFYFFAFCFGLRPLDQVAAPPATARFPQEVVHA